MSESCPDCGHPWVEHTHYRGQPITDSLGCVGDRYPGVKISGAPLRCACLAAPAPSVPALDLAGRQ